MADISQLANVSNAAAALSGLVLVSPQTTIGYQPQPAMGKQTAPPPAILFNYEGEQSVRLESDITDHYVEDNTAINDQIALRPEEVNTHGFIGELNDIPPAILAPLKTAAAKLTTISAYAPQASITAQLAYAEAAFLYSTAAGLADSAVAAWSTINGTGGESVIGSNGLIQQPNQSKQQLAFQQFYGYWRSRTLFTVQTPWAVFTNMAIKSLRAVQDAETDVITDFEVTFKIMRFSSTTIVNQGAFQGRAAAQAGGVTDLGPSSPPESTVNFGDSLAAVV